MSEAISLHVVVRDLHHQLGTQRLPRKVLPLAPATQSSWHARPHCLGGRPCFPWMIVERVVPVRGEKLHQLAATGHREAGANANMLQLTIVVEQSKQERPDRVAFPGLVPAESGDHAIAVAIVLHLEDHAL